MLAPEHWPQIPDELQEINAHLDARLAASPILGVDFFTPQQRRFIGIACEDTVPTSVSGDIWIGALTIKTHLQHAAAKFRESQPELNNEVPGTGRKPRIFQHRLAYVCLDNGLVTVGGEMDPAELTPEEALMLKSFAGSESIGTAIKHAKTESWALTPKLLSQLKEKMRASTKAGMMGNSYRMRLFVPRTVIQAPGEPEAVNS